MTTQASKKSDSIVKGDPAFLPDKEIDLEKSTNGPYDNFNLHAELQDDPAANMDQNSQDGYVSTIEPEKLTTIIDSNPSN